MRIFKFISEFLKSNIIKTITFNFKLLPLKDAIKMPIFLYGKVCLRNLDGSVEIRGRKYPGMIKIGANDWYVATHVPQCIWTVNGKIIFNGPVRFLQGSYVLVSHNATLEIGSKGAIIGADLKIMCFDHIKLGDNVRIPWNIQIIDTSFHYLENTDPTKDIKKLTAPIIIGDRVWIGNNTTISKGTVLPDDTIVASNSLVNKDFSSLNPYSFIAGSPAKFKAEGIRRVWDNAQQKQLDKQFGYDRTHL